MTDQAHIDTNHLQAGVETMLDGYATFRAIRMGDKTVDFEYPYINAAGASLLDRPAEDVIGRRLLELLPSAGGTELFDLCCRVVDSGEPMTTTHVSRRADAIKRVVAFRAWALDDGLAISWRDVTDRERALEAARAREDRFRTSLDQLHEAVSVFTAVRDDTDTIVDFRWVYANGAAASAIGRPADELVGRTLSSVLPEHKPSGMFDIYERVTETGEPWANSALWYEDVWGDGVRRRRAFDVRASKLHDGFVVVSRDVTAEREMEQRLLEQRAELEQRYEDMLVASERAHEEAQAQREHLEAQLNQSQRLESLGQLAGGVAHDFNNMLAAILGYTSFVREIVASEAADSSAPRWQHALDDVDQITRAAERAAELTKQLLAFARRDIVRPRPINLNAVVADVEHLLRRTIGEDVELVTSLDPTLLPINADPGQIEQVLLNLAVNARDAMPTGGMLTIDTATVDIDDEFAGARLGVAPGPGVRLRVGDTGTGMDADVKARIFDPFFTTKAKGEGTGLGLSTVYGIVGQAGGHISVYSEAGIGTTFTVLFPAVVNGAVAATGDSADDGELRAGTETVLLVEDDDAMREVTRRMLTRNGYVVLTAKDGNEATEVAAEHEGRIAVLLTDVVMPQMLGKEVAERLEAALPDLRTLYMSGYAQPVLTSRGTLEDDVRLLEKPFTEAELLIALRDLIELP